MVRGIVTLDLGSMARLVLFVGMGCLSALSRAFLISELTNDSELVYKQNQGA